MKLNNKGFTLIEILAVVIILSVLIVIMVPSVNYLIDKNKEDNYKSLKAGIISAAKVYLSDNRYNITLSYGDTLCDTDEENIASIAGNTLKDSKLPIKLLIDSKDLTTNSEGNITDPRDKSKILDINYNFEDSNGDGILDDTEYSYVLVKYQCSKKDYTYTLEDNSLLWIE